MRRLFCILSFVVLFYGVLFAQRDDSSKSAYVKKKYAKALNSFKNKNYRSALRNLNVVLERDSSFLDAYIIKYKIHRFNRDTVGQITCLNNLLRISPSFASNSFYILGELYFSLYKYRDALGCFKKFVAYSNIDNKKLSSAKSYIEDCSFAIEAMKTPRNVEISSVSVLNTSNDDYWPFVNLFSHDIYFTRVNNLVGGDENIMGYSISDSTFFNIPINTKYNEGTSSITADGRYLFFSSNRPNSYGSHDVFFARKTIEGWDKPINIGAPVNSEYWESQVSISADGKALYFASNRPGGVGGSDIYVSYLLKWNNKGCPVFSVPVNLSINTIEDDMAPYIYPNNKSLYFSSKGYPGMGGLDFYRVTLDEGNCSTPENLGYPINSNKDELGFVFSVDGSVLFGSKRKGNMDVYSCDMPLGLRHAPVVNRCGGVFDESGKNVNAKVIVVNNSDSTVYKLDDYGEVSLFLDSHFSYTLYILADGFNMYSENVFPIDSSRTCRIYKDVVMKKSVVGDKMILDNVTFDFDSFVLDDWSNNQLALWVEYMKVNKSLCFEIGGHTDCIGDSVYNMELSIKRAKAIYDYIVKRGVSKDRLVYKGYGNSLPVLSNTSEIGRSANRRTEIIILSR